MGVSLTQLVAMTQDKEMARLWLANHVDDVLEDLGRMHNLEMANAGMYSTLREGRVDKVERVMEILLEMERYA